jgi:hypothetical protein
MRFFRTADLSLYETIRLQLDAAWGHPSADGRTLTCFDPVAVSPRDGSGRVVLAVHDEFATWEPAATILPQLLASGAVEEISRADYMGGLQPPPFPQVTPQDFNVVPAGPGRVQLL